MWRKERFYLWDLHEQIRKSSQKHCHVSRQTLCQSPNHYLFPARLFHDFVGTITTNMGRQNPSSTSTIESTVTIFLLFDFVPGRNSCQGTSLRRLASVICVIFKPDEGYLYFSVSNLWVLMTC